MLWSVMRSLYFCGCMPHFSQEKFCHTTIGHGLFYGEILQTPNDYSKDSAKNENDKFGRL